MTTEPNSADRALAIDYASFQIWQRCFDNRAAAREWLDAFVSSAVAEAVESRDRRITSLEALVVRMREALETAARYLPTPQLGLIVQECKEALSLVPADLADCVVVKRGEWEDDKQRIDFLIANNLSVLLVRERWDGEMTYWWRIAKGTNKCIDHPFGDMRQAIDEAKIKLAALRPEAKGGAK